MWKRYSWADVDPDTLPLLTPFVESDTSETPVLSALIDPSDRGDALEIGFIPDHTYLTVLLREWNHHPAGSRVLLETSEFAIEKALPPVTRYACASDGPNSGPLPSRSPPTCPASRRLIRARFCIGR
jgi:hypothetical protein